MPPAGGIFYGMFRISNCSLWGNGLRRLRTFLQKGSKNSKNLQKSIDMPRDLIVGSIEETPMGPLPHWCI